MLQSMGLQKAGHDLATEQYVYVRLIHFALQQN